MQSKEVLAKSWRSPWTKVSQQMNPVSSINGFALVSCWLFTFWERSMRSVSSGQAQGIISKCNSWGPWSFFFSFSKLSKVHSYVCHCQHLWPHRLIPHSFVEKLLHCSMDISFCEKGKKVVGWTTTLIMVVGLGTTTGCHLLPPLLFILNPPLPQLSPL